MAEIVGAASLESLGIVGLVILFAVAMARGWLVTNRTHEQALQDLRDANQKALDDRDRQIVDWRDAYRAEAATNQIQSAQIEKLVEQGRTFVHLFDSMRAMFVSPQAGGAGDE